MQNIIKALNHQTRRDNFTIYALLAGCSGLGLFFLSYSNIDFSMLTGSVLAGMCGDCIALGVMLFLIVLVCRICGWDSADKTINYELLSGHNRAEVYWGRVLAVFMWAVPIVVLLILLPLAVASIFNGWGVEADFWGLMARYALAMLPVIRMICELIFFTFLLRNCYIAMILGYIFMMLFNMVEIIIEETAKVDISWVFSITNVIELMWLSNSYMGFVDGEDVMVYDLSVEPDYLLYTVLASVGVSAVCLLGGYLFFKKSDMN